MTAKLRWGLIGAGAISRDFAAGLAEARHGTLAAVASRSPASAETFARAHPGCRAHSSGEALLADASVDAVYIATPHPAHAEWTVRAARAGKHVLCEKPFAMNAAEAGRTFAAMRGTGVCVVEAFKERFHPLLDGVVAALPKIGEVRVIEGTFSFQKSFDPRARLFAREMGGGSILDVGCYPVNFARRIAGAAMGDAFADPLDVTGVAELGPTGTDLQAVGALRFANGVLAKLGCGITVAQEVCARIHGTEGSIFVPHPWARFPAGTARAIVTLVEGAEEAIEVTTDRSIFALEADGLAEAVAAGWSECPQMTWADTLGNLGTLDRWRAAVGLSYPADGTVSG